MSDRCPLGYLSLTADRRTDRLAQWGRAMYTHYLPCQKDYEGFKLEVSYSPISTLDGSKVRQVHDVARER